MQKIGNLLLWFLLSCPAFCLRSCAYVCAYVEACHTFYFISLFCQLSFLMLMFMSQVKSRLIINRLFERQMWTRLLTDSTRIYTCALTTELLMLFLITIPWYICCQMFVDSRRLPHNHRQCAGRRNKKCPKKSTESKLFIKVYVYARLYKFIQHGYVRCFQNNWASDVIAINYIVIAL